MSINTVIRLFLLLSIVNFEVFAANGATSTNYAVTIWRGGSAPAPNNMIVYRTPSKRDFPRSQHLCVQSGQEAWIQTGVSKRVPTVTRDTDGDIAFKNESERAEEGFALVILGQMGRRVTLKIMEKNERPRQDFRVQSDQKLATTLTARLDHWVLLGGSGDGPDQDKKDDTITIEKSSRADTRVYIKITADGCD